MDSARIAPNGQPYTLTSDPKEAAKGVNFILKEYDPNTRGVGYKISAAQSTDAEEFIRTQMRAKYNKEEKDDVVGQVSRDESARQKAAAEAEFREKKGKEEDLQTKGFTITPDVVSDSSQRAFKNIQSKLPAGFKVKDVGGYTQNRVEITAPNNKKYLVRTRLSGDDALYAVMGLEDFVKTNGGASSNTTIQFDSEGNIIQ
jgi:hypothetical protein